MALPIDYDRPQKRLRTRKRKAKIASGSIMGDCLSSSGAEGPGEAAGPPGTGSAGATTEPFQEEWNKALKRWRRFGLRMLF